MGIAIWSPRLDLQGNSYRGIKFFERLTERFSLSIFDQLMAFSSTKVDPTLAVISRRLSSAGQLSLADPDDHLEGDGDHAPANRRDGLPSLT